MEETALIKVKGLKKYFYGKKELLSGKQSTLKAVDSVDLTIMPGITVGLVGESGCGKSTLGRTVLKLHSITNGEVFYKGNNITNYNTKQMKKVRTKIQMIFQDPYNSLNPRKINFDSVKDALANTKLSDGEKNTKVAEMLELVGISKENYFKFPHELSGGQRQRVVIARAMVSNPDFIVCDEPVSALDVSVQAQVLNLMHQLQKEKNIAYLFISHNMSVVKFMCDEVAVMYLGKIVEYATKETIFNNPVHPYTKALLSSIPIADVDKKTQIIQLEGDIPSPSNPPIGCRFHTRCPYANEACSEKEPELVDLGNKHKVACIRINEIS